MAGIKEKLESIGLLLLFVTVAGGTVFIVDTASEPGRRVMKAKEIQESRRDSTTNARLRQDSIEIAALKAQLAQKPKQ